MSFLLDCGLMIRGRIHKVENYKIIVKITHGLNTLLGVHYMEEVDELTGDVVKSKNKLLNCKKLGSRLMVWQIRKIMIIQ